MTQTNKDIPQNEGSPQPSSWNALVIDDDPEVLADISDYFSTRPLAGRTVDFKGIKDWNEAFNLIRDHKVDFVILDIYRGQAMRGGDRVGERVLEDIKGSGFVCVVIYTNLAEGLEPEREEFVRLVLKADGLPRLEGELKSLFDTRVPLMHRAIVNQMDRALRDYMWGFITQNWPTLKTVADKPEFLRLLLQRLALSFVREGVGEAMIEVFGTKEKGEKAPTDLVHPAELYIKPPIGPDPLLGDVRKRQVGDKTEYLIVLWPSCDMVSTGGRRPKTNTVLCANGLLLDSMEEVHKYRQSQSRTTTRQLTDLLTNKRDTNFGTPDRFHFLPGFLDIPNLIVDFQEVERLALADVNKLPSLGSLASPYAEHLGSRFTRYLSRIGTPDADLADILGSLTPEVTVAPPSAQPTAAKAQAGDDSADGPRSSTDDEDSRLRALKEQIPKSRSKTQPKRRRPRRNKEPKS